MALDVSHVGSDHDTPKFTLSNANYCEKRRDRFAQYGLPAAVEMAGVRVGRI
jgi:hypothetical protein